MAITSTLLLIHYCSMFDYLLFLYLVYESYPILFFPYQKFRYSDMERNPGLRWLEIKVLCINVWGLFVILSDLTDAASLFDLLLCSKTLVSDGRHMYELQVWIWLSHLTVPQWDILSPMDIHLREMDMEHFVNCPVKCGY